MKKATPCTPQIPVENDVLGSPYQKRQNDGLIKERVKVFRSLNLPIINYYYEKVLLYKVLCHPIAENYNAQHF